MLPIPDSSLPNRPCAQIDLDALATNWRKLADLSAHAETSAVVKANAYGIGVAQTATRLWKEGCRTFFVAYDFEAQELRSILGNDARIFVFNGPDDPRTLTAINAIPVLNSMEQASRWQSTGAPAVLHIDTGMNRLGLRPTQVPEFKANFADLNVTMVMSHLACADEVDNPMNPQQRDAFVELAASFPGAIRSFANTGGICLGPDYCFDLTRPGIGLYGGYKHPRFTPEPVVTLTAPLLTIFHPDKDDPLVARSTIGYGASARINAGQKIGIIAAGYADGLFRHLSNCGHAAIAGRIVSMIGRVSMDLIALDLSDVPSDVQVGDRVEIFGPTLNLEEQAETAGTISYELLTSIGHRVERVYQGNMAVKPQDS